MTDNDREQIALFRFSLISPILNRQVKKQNEYLAKVAAKNIMSLIMESENTHQKPYPCGLEPIAKVVLKG